MMRQAVALFRSQNNKQTIPALLQFEKNMTIKGKKNSKVKIVKNKKRHNYWGNIFRRKRIMSEYFSDSAFGSQSDTKIELYNPWEDPDKLAKFKTRQWFEYEYDENEIMQEQEQKEEEPKPKFDITKVSFMQDPNSYSINTKKDNNNK